MKGRSVKLREAHKGGGSAVSPSLCSVLWGLDGAHLVTASAADPSVSIHDVAIQPPKPAATLCHHKDGVTALALSPCSGCLATASIDHSVKLYSFPDGEFQSNVTRFTLPIRSLAFNKSGSLLAVAGDDDGIKLIATIDCTISKVLKGHKGSVTCLAFDPKNEYLASIDEFGTLMYWELSSGKPIHTLQAVAPNCDLGASVLNVISWSPDGETLAVPGLRNDVVLYDRDTAEKVFALKGDHERPICSLCWSPNGKYMATSGLDNQVLIWDVELRVDIERQKFDEIICCLDWKPNGNALVLIDVMGRYGIWEPVVPSSMKSPTEGAPSMQARQGSRVSLFDEEDEKPSTSGSLDNAIDEGRVESAPSSHRRLRKKPSYEEETNENSEGEELMDQIESHKRNTVKHKESSEKRNGDGAISRSLLSTRMQEAFQAGSTPSQAGKRCFLSYNMLGSITTMENDGYSHVEVDFHDTGRGPRVPSMTDYFGFTMASLNEHGSVFANPCKGEKNMSTLMYRPFSSWANNTEWSMRFEGEEVKAVAVGKGWVAAVTSLNFLRIFTEGGLQRHILSINGPVVTAAGFGDQLAIVTHASDCLPYGDQILEVKVFNVSEGTQPASGRLPLTPSSYLTWFGFNEDGQLSSYDSKGILRVFCSQYGGSWLPVFSSSKARKSVDECHWIVGLNASKLFCIVCKLPDLYPQVMPKPVLTILDLSFPLASSDLGAEDLENEFIMRSLNLAGIQSKMTEMAAAGLDTAALDDEAFNMEAAIDRCILRLIASCCNGDKLVRATELARLLSLEKSVKGAIKLATALKLPILAERISSVLEERQLKDFNGRGAIPSTGSNGVLTNNTQQTGVIDKAAQSAPALQPPPLPPHFSKQEKSENKDPNDGTKKTSAFQISHELVSKSTRKPKHQDETQHEAKRERDVESCRPANPFAKSSVDREKKSSLLESIKKMKEADREKNEQPTNKKSRV